MNAEYQRPPIRIALMGLGRAMFEDHFSVFAAHPALFDVVAACDVIKSRRDRVAKVFPKCKMFRQLEDMLDERDIDVVDIATCSEDHIRHAMASLTRGFYTLLEPPMAFSPDEAQVLRGASAKAGNRLVMFHRGIFDADYLLAKQVIASGRLGRVYHISVCQEDYIRRDDWQAIRRQGGGAAYYAMPDLFLKTFRLLPNPPAQMFSELKRIVSLGDAEDYARVNLKTRDLVSADIEYNGGLVGGPRSPSLVVRGDMGVLSCRPGAVTGELVYIPKEYKFPRRRSSVKTPSLADLHEDIPVVREEVSLERGTGYGPTAFWKCLYNTVRVAAPFPMTFEDALEVVRFTHLIKKTSPYGVIK